MSKLTNGLYRMPLQNGLYHFETGLPLSAESFKFGTVNLSYTKHARFAALDDRYGPITLPETLNTNISKVIEVQIENGRVSKIVYRTKYSAEYDIIFVVSNGGMVKTVWLNSVNDTHGTLKAERYQRAV